MPNCSTPAMRIRFEVWNERGELAGGGYGVAIGASFVTESQFSREPNTSKIGFTVLNWHLAHWGFAFNDGKLMTPTCRDMGFREIPRGEFLSRLAQAERRPGTAGPLAGRGGYGGSRGLAAAAGPALDDYWPTTRFNNGILANQPAAA